MKSCPSAVAAMVLFAAMAVMSGPAAAEDEAQSRSVEACRDSADEAALRACRDADLAAVKAEVDAQVKILFERYNEDGPDHAEVLTAAQAAWAAFMEAECRHLTYESSLGTAAAVYEQECQSTLYRRRSAELQELVDSP